MMRKEQANEKHNPKAGWQVHDVTKLPCLAKVAGKDFSQQPHLFKNQHFRLKQSHPDTGREEA